MATFGAVKTAIARRLLDESHTAVTDIEIGEAINEAIKKWKSTKFWFNTTDYDLVIAAGDTTLTLPDDFMIEIPRNAVTITQSGSVRQVEKVSPTVFDGFNSDDATGLPTIYTNRDGELQIYPASDADYAGKLYYLKDYDDFLTDGTQDALTNDFLDEGRMLTQNEALMNLHGELRQDDEMEARYKTRRDEELNSLKNRTVSLLRTGTLTVEQ